jgi:hypothetical protein
VTMDPTACLEERGWDIVTAMVRIPCTSALLALLILWYKNPLRETGIPDGKGESEDLSRVESTS